MNHSLRSADFETHVRIVAISLAAAIGVVIGALNMKFQSHGDGYEAWGHASVVKASRQSVHSANDRPFIR